MAKLPIKRKSLNRDISKRKDDQLTPLQYKQRYSGTKRVPQVNIEFAKSQLATKKQAQNRVNSKKVRPKESLDAWKARMKRNNLISEQSIEKILELKKYKFQIDKLKKVKDIREREHANKYIRIIFCEKNFDFLSNLGMIKNYFCVKHAIRKDDFDIALAMYNNKIITQERFNNVCLLNVGRTAGYFKRFKESNYLIEIEIEKEFQTKESKIEKTGIYKMNIYLCKVINNFYKLIAKFETLKDRNLKRMYSPELEKEFIKLNDEIEDYLTGNIKQELSNK
jgi:hypothetical protein